MWPEVIDRRCGARSQVTAQYQVAEDKAAQGLFRRTVMI